VLAGQTVGARAATPDHSRGRPVVDAARRAEQLAGIVALADRLATLTDLEAALEAVADATMAVIGPSACAIDLVNEGSGERVISLTRGLDTRCAAWWRQTGGGSAPSHDGALTWPAELAPSAPAAAMRLPLGPVDRPAIGTLTLFAAAPEAALLWPADLLRSIAIQAAAAVTSSRVRLRDVQAVYSVAQAITGRIDLAQLADAVLESVVGLFAADGGALALTDGRLAPDADPQVVARVGAGYTAEMTAVLGWRPQQTEPMVLARLSPPERANEDQRGVGLAAPLALDRKLLGMLILTYPAEQVFRQSDLWLLAAIASQATMALRNAQLYLWSEELAIAEERSRIAREIHDGLAQSLAHKIVKLELCQKLIGRDEPRLRAELDTIKASVRADIQDVRHSILALRPLDLEHRGLSEAVLAYVNQFSNDTGIAIEARVAPLDGIAPKAQTALFRLVQEALNNIRKHAQADRASLAIDIGALSEIHLTIVDNGRGFDVPAALRRQPGHTGIGLKGMIERTTAAGGVITIDSAPGQGARIAIRLPGR
jgi:signal transduction histidine kinase